MHMTHRNILFSNPISLHWKVARFDQFMASKANMKHHITPAVWANQYQKCSCDVDSCGTKPQIYRQELPGSLVLQYRALDDIHSSAEVWDNWKQQNAELSGATCTYRLESLYYYVMISDSLNRSIATDNKLK